MYWSSIQPWCGIFLYSMNSKTYKVSNFVIVLKIKKWLYSSLAVVSLTQRLPESQLILFLLFCMKLDARMQSTEWVDHTNIWTWQYGLPLALYSVKEWINIYRLRFSADFVHSFNFVHLIFVHSNKKYIPAALLVPRNSPLHTPRPKEEA